jgi:uncharacterized protein YbdZ (MbtH family)
MSSRTALEQRWGSAAGDWAYMAERKSISTVHVFWKEQGGTPGGWYIETRNAYSEAVGDSQQPDWDGPPPKHYQKHEAEKLCAHLQLWEPEARVIMHL